MPKVLNPEQLMRRMTIGMTDYDLLEFLKTHLHSTIDQLIDNAKYETEEEVTRKVQVEKDIGDLEDLGNKVEEEADRANAAEEWGQKQHDRAEEYKAMCEKFNLLTNQTSDAIEAKYE
ncbi:MAG: hypothetical protein K0U41_06720 [Gammaproteobacteria bacterium]|nr:hypothetical protein [Gammaproteobacteria bacterium]